MLRVTVQSALQRLGSAMQGRTAQGVLVATLSFLLLGSVAALWDNPLFVRMTPAGAWEIAALLSMSMLSGIYIAIRRQTCSMRPAGAGGIIGFVGIACPTCNKVLMLLFGGELLMVYLEPIRPHLATLGVLILFAVTLREVLHRRERGSDGASAVLASTLTGASGAISQSRSVRPDRDSDPATRGGDGRRQT